MIDFNQNGATDVNFLLTRNNGSYINNNTQRIFRIDVKMSSRLLIYVYLETSNGQRYLSYSPSHPANGVSSYYLNHALSPDYTDGRWHTIIRDLQADAEALEPGIVVQQVDYILVGGTGRVDNVALMDRAELGAIRGRIIGPDGNGLAGVTVSVDNNIRLNVTTGADGSYVLPSLANGAYTVRPHEFGYTFNPASAALVVENSQPVQQDFTAALTGIVTAGVTPYEDAEDNSTRRWREWANSPRGTIITNVIDEETNSRVIDFNQNGATDVNFLLTRNNGSYINNNTQRIFRIDVKMSSRLLIYVYLETSNGQRYLSYSPSHPANGVSSYYLNHALSPDYTDGRWHTIIRDLQADAEALEPGIVVQQVDYILVGGTGRVDNVALMDNMP